MAYEMASDLLVIPIRNIPGPEQDPGSAAVRSSTAVKLAMGLENPKEAVLRANIHALVRQDRHNLPRWQGD